MHMSWVNEIVISSRCTICGGREFRAGPNGRLNNGVAPCCVLCYSLERHRVLYSLYNDSLRERVKGASCLHFAPDHSIDRRWFEKYEPSTYGGENSLDLQNIDRPSGHYDWVICNHVLEHVEDDRGAMREMLRITADGGIVQFAIPMPLYRERTHDWGAPDIAQHGHWRVYGKDFLTRFEGVLSTENLLSVVAVDPVTGYRDVVFFAARSREPLDRLRVLLGAQVVRLGAAAK
jgi:SAM-dependent methyltransferase